MTEGLVPGAPAGWYPDPFSPYHQRYWDGVQWTQVSTPFLRQQETSVFAILSIVMIFVFVPLSIVFGIMGRQEVDRSNGAKTGRTMATVGMWIGIAYMSFMVLLFVGILIFSLTASSTTP
jgi:hypothetical protein